jgi:dTDP-L-rhamnose 4-epimerase
MFSRGDLMLVTGGAGFIGSHTVDALLERGYRVRILDILQERVHPKGKPQWVPSDAEFIRGDAANYQTLRRALEGVAGVFHLAAYQDYLPNFSEFVHNNTESSALLFELIVLDRERFPVRKIVFASSQSVCGEGVYYCGNETEEPAGTFKPVRGEWRGAPIQERRNRAIVRPGPRSLEQLLRAEWEVQCPLCGEPMEPLLIDEGTSMPHTTYAISKHAIEQIAARLGQRYGIATACMRYTYVQGPRNSFYNAYSGIARRFALRIMSGLPPVAYEDGGQLRDYVNVGDVAKANVLALERPETDFQVLNVGGGRAITVLEFARLMLQQFGSKMEPEVPGEFRVGDTRHTVSDITRMRALGWEPTTPVEENIKQYVEWITQQPVPKNLLPEAEAAMKQSGVVRRARAANAVVEQ